MAGMTETMSKTKTVSATRNLVLSALFLALGIVLPFLTGTDTICGKHASSDAHSGTYLRFCMRRSLRIARRCDCTAFKKRDVWYAADDGCYSDGF